MENIKVLDSINKKINNIVIPYYINIDTNTKLIDYLNDYINIELNSSNKNLIKEIERKIVDSNNPISLYITLDKTNYHLFIIPIILDKDTIKLLSSKTISDEIGEILDVVRICGAELVSTLDNNNILSINIGLTNHFKEIINTRLNDAFLEGLLLNLYTFDKYKTDKTDKNELETINLIYPNKNKEHIKRQQNLVNNLIVKIKSVYLARDLVNEPANILTTDEFIRVIRAFIKLHEIPVDIEVWDKTRLNKENMNLLVSVGEGSSKESQSKLLIIKYSPTKNINNKIINKSVSSKKTIKSIPSKMKTNKKSIKNRLSMFKFKSEQQNHKNNYPDYVLIGKGVLFDTGGINLKPGSDMNEMKSDMAGAAIIASFILGHAKLNKSSSIVGLIPLAENNLGKGATRPGDVIVSHSGKTVEIIDTDAEGRLLLADCLSYANKKYTKSKVIDIATLTGHQSELSCKLFSNVISQHSKFVEAIVNAGNYISESIVEMPYIKKYRKFLDSEVADIRNISTTCGSDIMTSSIFLSEFIDNDKTWAHIDIAGTSWDMSDEIPYAPGEGSGVGVRLLFQLIN